LSALERPDSTSRTAAGAVAELYGRHARMVAGICSGMLRDPDEAADAVQETFLAAQRSLLAGTHPNEPAAWLATIARNECRMRIRRRMAAPVTRVLDENLDGSGDTTYGGAVQAAGVEELREALDDMPERQREALLLREVRGLSYEEVAKAMDVSSPAVETLIFRARKRVVERVRIVPSLVFAWAKDSLTRLGGPADVATAGAFAAKGAAALIAALTATSAAVEVKDRATASTTPAAVVARVDNSGPGSASSGRGRGGDDDEVRNDSSGKGSGSRAEDSSGSSGSGKGRGRGRGRSGSD
jgi:RNA polymerase sigma factor (sigma-70 family)